MNRLRHILEHEPVMVVALVNAALALLLAFGLELTVEQVAAIVTVVELTLALIVRSAVTPTSQLL